MRRILLPDTLTVFHLIALPDETEDSHCYSLYKQLVALVKEARDEDKGILERVRTIIKNALDLNDHYTAALAELILAEIYRREENLVARECAHNSTKWLRFQVSATARYNEALGYYFLGFLDYRQGKDREANQLLHKALSGLENVEQYWSHHPEHAYWGRCRDIVAWIHDLLRLQQHFLTGRDVTILPFYTYDPESEVITFCGAKAVEQKRLDRLSPTQVSVTDPPPAHNYFVLYHEGVTKDQLVGTTPPPCTFLVWPEPLSLYDEDISHVHSTFRRENSGHIVFRAATERHVGAAKALSPEELL